jgi:hypothetical protein
VFVTVNRVGPDIKVIKPCGTGTVEDDPATKEWGYKLPVKSCGGRSIDNEDLMFAEYAIEEKLVNGRWETAEEYKRSDRHHKKDHVKLPMDLLILL